jgi:hypothetical protein
MRLKTNRKTVLTMLVMMTAMLALPPGHAALFNYSQDFETLNQADPAALSTDGWLIFANVYDTDKTTLIDDYGIFVAPNGGAGFSTITATSDNQQLKTFSDYTNDYNDNTIYRDGEWIEALVFQQQIVSAADVGSIWSFTFDVKQGDQVPDSSSTAFLRTSTSGSILDTTAYGMDWGTETLSLLIDSSMVDQMLQFGFSSTATGYTASGVLYDNISFSSTVIPVPGAIWLMMSGLIGLVGIARRRQH